MKFVDASQFAERLDPFLYGVSRGTFDPRADVVATLSLEECAQRYLGHLASIPRA